MANLPFFPYTGIVGQASAHPWTYREFRIQMLLAKRKSVPILPPVRPIIQNASSLELLGRLQFFHEDAAYRSLLKSESEAPGPSGFAHPL